jgi:predicted ribosomally synthesized peptide with SipW-like signal peptide
LRRSILFSLMVIGAVIAVVAGASTFSAFTSTDNISGTVTAGKLKIDLADTGATPSENSLTFDLNTACGEMTPTDTCTVLIQLCNGTSAAGVCTGSPSSNLEEYISAATFEELAGDSDNCFSGVLTTDTANGRTISIADGTVGATGTGDTATFTVDSAATESLDPGDFVVMKLTVSLADDNACQGDAATYKLSVTATQTNTPHD